MATKAKLILAVIALCAAGLYSSAFVVNEYERVLVLQLGKVKLTDEQLNPGLHFKVPFFDDVVKLDGRVFTRDGSPEELVTADKTNLIVDFYIQWRIKQGEAVKFYTSTGNGNIQQAGRRLDAIIKSAVKNQIGQRTESEVVSSQRDDLMKNLAISLNESSADLGIEVVDVRIEQVQLPPKTLDSRYDEMVAERDRVAKDRRARGNEEKERTQSTADKERTVILAKAEKEAQDRRAEGEGEAAKIYADAYGKDPEFYRFYQSLKAYKGSMNSKDDVLVLSPDSEFFEYFKSYSK